MGVIKLLAAMVIDHCSALERRARRGTIGTGRSTDLVGWLGQETGQSTDLFLDSHLGSQRLTIYAAMPYNLVMVFIETSLFTKLVYNYLTDEEYLGLQGFLFGYPDAGPVVPGSGGVRKLRWAVAGRGKRGGVRVIYYWKRSDGEIWMLTMYGKNETSTIPAHMLKRIAKEIEDV